MGKPHARVARRVLGIALGALALVLIGLAALRFAPGSELAPPQPGAALVKASQGLDTISAELTFDPVNRELTVRQTCELTNRTGATQRLLVLRAYANAFQSEDTSPAATEELFDTCYPDGFSAGGLTLTAVTVQKGGIDEQPAESPQPGGAGEQTAEPPQAGGAGEQPAESPQPGGTGEQTAETQPSGTGEQIAESLPGGTDDQPADYTFSDDAQTVLTLSLPWDWGAGETLTARFQYTVRIPQAAYRFGERDGVFALGHALLLPAPYRNGEAVTDAYGSIGEPFMSECRNYTVRVTVPTGYAVAGSAAAVTETEADGQRTVRMDAPAARDFALCVSRLYRVRQAVQDGVLVRAYAGTDATAGDLLTYAMAALRCYGERYGAYPYPCYTVCETGLPYGGMTYPGLAMLSAGEIAAGGEKREQLVARETAQQWWSAVIGTDGTRQPWQDEALSEFSLLDYWESRHGKAARDALQFSRLDTAMRVTIPRGVTPGSPVDYFGDTSEYRVVVWGRGGAALCALNDAMGGQLDAFLRRYGAEYAFALATRADFETLLKAVTGEDWSPLLSDYLDTYIDP